MKSENGGGQYYKTYYKISYVIPAEILEWKKE